MYKELQKHKDLLSPEFIKVMWLGPSG